MVEKNEVVLVNTDGELVEKAQVMTVTQELQQGGQDTFSSMNLEGADIVTKARVSNALATPDKRIADEINMTLFIKDIIIHKVNLINDDNEEVAVPRVILIDTDGVSHVAVSKGIYNVIRTNIFPLFGFPTYEEGLPLLVQQGGSGTRKYLTLVPDIKALEKQNKK